MTMSVPGDTAASQAVADAAAAAPSRWITA